MLHCHFPLGLQWSHGAVGGFVTIQRPLTSSQWGGGGPLITAQLHKIQCPTQPSLTSPQQESGESHYGLVRMEFRLFTQFLLVRNSPVPVLLAREFCLHRLIFPGCWFFYFQTQHIRQTQNKTRSFTSMLFFGSWSPSLITAFSSSFKVFLCLLYI